MYQNRSLLARKSILFVDDEAPIAKMGSQILERLGYAVTARTSSIEALELFQTKPNDFDLVVTDMTMPNMTGDALARGVDENPCGYSGNSLHRLQQKDLRRDGF